MKGVENGNGMTDGSGYANGHEMDVNGNANAYAVGTAGHDGVGTGQYRPPAAQNF